MTRTNSTSCDNTDPVSVRLCQQVDRTSRPGVMAISEQPCFVATCTKRTNHACTPSTEECAK
jgi:hypothetical protein